jgi:hypothetical protein
LITEDFKIARKETVNIWETLQQNVKCLGPKLTQRLGRKPAPSVDKDFNIDIVNDFEEIPNREIGFLEKLKNTVTRYGAKLTVDQRVEDFNIDINDFEQIPNREVSFLEKLQNTVTRYGEKLKNIFTKKPEAEERDVLAYPYHIENYKVNPFKETDRANFWEQVEYDWDTDEFQWLRQEIGKGWEKFVSNVKSLRPKLSEKFEKRPIYSHTRSKVRQFLILFVHDEYIPCITQY